MTTGRWKRLPAVERTTFGAVHAAPHEDDSVGSSGVGGSDDGAGVSGVLGLSENSNDPGPLQRRCQRLGAGGLLSGDDGEDALGVGAHGVHDLFTGDVDVELRSDRLLPDISMALDGGFGEVDIEDTVGGVADRLTYALGAFDEEAAVLVPDVAAGQAGHA